MCEVLNHKLWTSTETSSVEFDSVSVKLSMLFKSACIHTLMHTYVHTLIGTDTGKKNEKWKHQQTINIIT